MRACLSVVGIRIRNRIRIRVAIGRGDPVAGDPGAPVGPPRQVFVPAALAAEWLPPIVARPLAAPPAQRRLIHPNYFSGTVRLTASDPAVGRLAARRSSATSSFT